MSAAPTLASCPHASVRATVAAGLLAPGEAAFCGACSVWVDAPPARPPRERVQTYVSPEAPAASTDDPPPRRAGTRARLDADAAEAERVRLLACALRPDCADPLRPPPRDPTASYAPTVRDPQASWGGTPSGLTETGEVRAPVALDSRAAVVLERLAALPPDARAVLTWMRERADVRGIDSPDPKARRAALRGCYVEAGRAFAGVALTERWAGDLTAQRDGAAALGRRVVLAAAAAWEGSEVGDGTLPTKAPVKTDSDG